MEAKPSSAVDKPPSVRRRWLRLVLTALAVLLGLWGAAWLGMPPLLKWQFQKQASDAIGRTVTVDTVDFRPWTLELDMAGLRVADAAGSGTQFSLQRLYLNAELQSLLRLAPVLDALTLEQPRLRLRHLGQGRYDVDDVLQRLAQPGTDPPADPARFAVFNIELTGGDIELTDEPMARTHRLRDLVLKAPFLSNLDSRRDVQTQPELAFVLNDSAFQSRATSTPFADSRATEVVFDVPALDLAPYRPYWPVQWSVRPETGILQLAIKLAFEQSEKPQVLLSGEVSLSDVRLAQVLPGGADADLLSLDRLEVKIGRLEPLAQRMDLTQVTLTGPSLWLARDAAGRLNLDRIAAGFAAPDRTASPAPPVAPWQVRLNELLLERGTLHWNDASVQPAARLALEDIRSAVQGAGWPVLAPIPFEASARLGATPLTVQGSATDATALARLSVGELPLGLFAPYMKGALEPPLAGRVSAELELDWRAAAGAQPMGLTVRAPRLALQALTLGPPQRPLASLQGLLLEGGEIDLAARAVTVDQLVIQRPRAQIERDAQGQWSHQRWAASGSRPTAPEAPTAVPSPPWKLALLAVRLNDGGLQLLDQRPSGLASLALSGIQLQVKNLRPLDARQALMPVSLSARLADAGGGPAEPGRLDFNGSLRLPSGQPGDQAAGLLARGQLQAERLPVHALEPYFGDQLNLELLRADASYRGSLEAALPAEGLALKLAGDVALEDFRAHTLSPSEELLAWKSLNLRGLQMAMAPGQGFRLSVGETVLSDYFARLIISEAGRINLQGLVKDGSAPSVASGTTAGTVSASASPTLAAGPPPDIRFGPVSLVNGRVFFSDRFIQPNYSANLSELSGGLSAFSNASTSEGGTPQLADLALRGRAEGTASLEIGGRLNPLATPLALDIQGKVRDLELPPLSPYTVKYAGHGIERGKLSVDVAYRIAPDGLLSASNQIILNQLAFGERVAGSDAPNLPVRLAVALLADRNGVIDINLPVSGSLNDPQFRLAPIIFKLILNLIGKAITAPFSLLAGALGGGGDELSQVAFAPGSAVLDDQGRQRLDAVAKALADRPALQLTVVGHSDLEAERSGYRRTRLDAQVLAEKRRALARSGAAVTGTVVVTPAEYPALLKEVYRRADISKPRNLVGLAKDLPVPDMEALLLAAIPVTADALRELAVARGVAVKDHLASRALPESRMFLGAPRLAREGDAWTPQAELKLAPR